MKFTLIDKRTDFAVCFNLSIGFNFMRFKTITASALILMSGVTAFAQSTNYAAVAGHKTNVGGNVNVSKHVVSVDEWAKMRFDANREIERGWRKAEWKAAGISLAVPEEFEFVAHRDDRKTADWQAQRWQSRLPQRNDIEYKIWISVENYKTRGKKTTAQLLSEEEEVWNTTDGSDVSDLPPITHLRLNGVDGIISRWHVPYEVHFTWTTFRIYQGKLQKIRVQATGREEVISNIREILKSIKIAQN